MAASHFFAVEIGTDNGFVPSRSFRTLFAARKWAKRCQPSRIVKCSLGGVREVIHAS